ncbi:MAG: hypothetical protein WC124_02185 [Desulfoplanes sp.]
MDIKKCRIGARVRVQGEQEGTIIEIYRNGIVRVDFGPNDYHYVPFHAANVGPIDPDVCVSCQQLDFVRSERDEYLRSMIKERENARVAQEKCNALQKALDEMTCKSNAANRNARYWREELTKLQTEALECDKVPLAEVAKIYIQISPAVLDQIVREE